MKLDSGIIQQLLDLPAAERADLARRLILSLEPANSDVDLESLWEAEIEARMSSLDRGEVTLLDPRESIQRIRGSLQQNKGQ